MNFKINSSDSIKEVISKRIAYFKEVHTRHADLKTRSLCELKISTLEMVLNDLGTLDSLRNTKVKF
ncbi:MAG: hypothetical protein NE334_00240 [Lentisphaeraceae bacterium]|nr:hypothetical protein [Lentisphaeraceae bacterium]